MKPHTLPSFALLMLVLASGCERNLSSPSVPQHEQDAPPTHDVEEEPTSDVHPEEETLPDADQTGDPSTRPSDEPDSDVPEEEADIGATDVWEDADKGDTDASTDGEGDADASSDPDPHMDATDEVHDADEPDILTDASDTHSDTPGPTEDGTSEPEPGELLDACSASAPCEDSLVCAPPWARCVPQGMRLSPAGTFTMGSPESEPGRFFNEHLRQVTQSVDVLFDVYPVTNEVWTALTAHPAPSYHASCGACPVEEVTWWSALWFANQRSTSEGLPPCYLLPASCSGSGPAGTLDCGRLRPSLATSSHTSCGGYRLPTEAEWERAVRAGTTGPLWTGNLPGDLTGCADLPQLSAIAWYCGNVDEFSPAPVGQLAANPWGLYDMLGNVFEWTWDSYQAEPESSMTIDPVVLTGDRIVLRGGSFQDTPRRLRAASRSNLATMGVRAEDIGFRLVRNAPQ